MTGTPSLLQPTRGIARNVLGKHTARPPKERGILMASSGFVAALEAQSERTKLLDELYGRLSDPYTAEAERRIRNFSHSEKLSRRHSEKRSRFHL